MITIEIKQRFTGAVLFSHTQEDNNLALTVTKAVETNIDLSNANLSYANLNYVNLSNVNLSNANLIYTDLSYANLSYANLSSTNLSSADLSYADLSFTNLNYANLNYANLDSANLTETNYGEGILLGKSPLFIYGLTWPVYIFKDHIKIGCQLQSKVDWSTFSDYKIDVMSEGALVFWKKYKELILSLATTNNEGS